MAIFPKMIAEVNGAYLTKINVFLDGFLILNFKLGMVIFIATPFKNKESYNWHQILILVLNKDFKISNLVYID